MSDDDDWRIKIPAIEWTVESDPSELAQRGASQWITATCLGVGLRIAQWTEGEREGTITLRIMHAKYDNPNWLDIAYNSIDKAKESAPSIVQSIYASDIRTYYTDKYHRALVTVRQFAPDAECVDLGEGYFPFWGKLHNGYEVAVSNHDMEGIESACQDFCTGVYRDGKPVKNIVYGALAEQLAKVTNGGVFRTERRDNV